MSTDLSRIIDGLLGIKPDDYLVAAQMFVSRLLSGEVTFDLPGLPDELFEIQVMRGVLWELYHGDVAQKVSDLRTIPPIPSSSIPPDF